jgi:hypothetical protein
VGRSRSQIGRAGCGSPSPIGTGPALPGVLASAHTAGSKPCQGKQERKLTALQRCGVCVVVSVKLCSARWTAFSGVVGIAGAAQTARAPSAGRMPTWRLLGFSPDRRPASGEPRVTSRPQPSLRHASPSRETDRRSRVWRQGRGRQLTSEGHKGCPPAGRSGRAKRHTAWLAGIEQWVRPAPA